MGLNRKKAWKVMETRLLCFRSAKKIPSFDLAEKNRVLVGEASEREKG